LKEQIGVDKILARVQQLNDRIFEKLLKIKNLHLLAKEHTDRLGFSPFILTKPINNLITKLLNDRFGIQTCGGCSCAGTYGHYLLNVNKQSSKVMEQKILEGCLIERPGWFRMSIQTHNDQ
jgi:selenocysteine lyase/cysteine desulfurase